MKPIWPVPPNHPPLEANTAHIWAVTVDAEPTNIDRCLSILSADELRRANSFQVDAPRRQFIVTRAALRTLLARYLDLPSGEITIEYDEHKKPRLAVQQASRDLQFNVAHSSDLALIAIARGTPIGVDVERHRVMRLAEPISQRYFHPAEAISIASAPASQRDAMFLRIWTLKEAVLKAIGSGLTDRLSGFCLPPETTDFEVWNSVLILMPSQFNNCYVRQLDIGDDYFAAVAVAQTPNEIHCMQFVP